jgi:hypothetical protein
MPALDVDGKQFYEECELWVEAVDPAEAGCPGVDFAVHLSAVVDVEGGSRAVVRLDLTTEEAYLLQSRIAAARERIWQWRRSRGYDRTYRSREPEAKQHER